ncbi:unnamed protein product [Schistosoma mattheei]|uniref:Uncharacterized protein n=1 Tax=Schistosoma mattheei TaxID=31246 RepID=A0A3P8HGI0_9TREM|nr:unnamed protein product [Schistosoma mattheei]
MDSSSNEHIRDSADNPSNVSSVISKHNPPIPLPIDMLNVRNFFVASLLLLRCVVNLSMQQFTCDNE